MSVQQVNDSPMKQIMTQLFEQHQHDQERLIHLEARVQQLTRSISELSAQVTTLSKLQHKLGHYPEFARSDVRIGVL
jgi:prefoldin subunit 5